MDMALGFLARKVSKEVAVASLAHHLLMSAEERIVGIMYWYPHRKTS